LLHPLFALPTATIYAGPRKSVERVSQLLSDLSSQQVKTYLGAEISCICRGAPGGAFTVWGKLPDLGKMRWVLGPGKKVQGLGFSGRASSLKRKTSAPENGGTVEVWRFRTWFHQHFSGLLLLVSGSVKFQKFMDLQNLQAGFCSFWEIVIRNFLRRFGEK